MGHVDLRGLLPGGTVQLGVGFGGFCMATVFSSLADDIPLGRDGSLHFDLSRLFFGPLWKV